MKDSLIILAFVIWSLGLSGCAYALGRLERRMVYTPGPPQGYGPIESGGPLPAPINPGPAGESGQRGQQPVPTTPMPVVAQPVAPAAPPDPDMVQNIKVGRMPAIVYGDPLDRSTWTAPGGFLVIPPALEPEEDS